jgi:hypothetical protein
LKYLPIVLVFAAGIAVGLYWSRTPPEEPAAATHAPMVVFDTPAPASTAPAQAPPPPPLPFGSSRSASDAAPVPRSYPPAPDAGEPGYSQPIDAGPVFNQQFASAEKQGMQDAVLQAHRTLERETRDDSWSYPLEAEIENSLVADTSIGNFRREHLECRATLCELRLSAEGGEQIEALRQWTSDIQKFPWAARVVLSSSSSISSDTRMDALMILAKPPPTPDGPPPDGE